MLESAITDSGLGKNLRQLRCTAWLSKGSMKKVSSCVCGVGYSSILRTKSIQHEKIQKGNTVFLCVGATVTLTSTIGENNTALHMPHGSLLFTCNNTLKPVAVRTLVQTIHACNAWLNLIYRNRLNPQVYLYVCQVCLMLHFGSHRVQCLLVPLLPYHLPPRRYPPSARSNPPYDRSSSIVISFTLAVVLSPVPRARAKWHLQRIELPTNELLHCTYRSPGHRDIAAG